MKYIVLLLCPLFLAWPLHAQSDTTSFATGLEGWTAGFADYPAGQEVFYALTSSHAALPSPLDPTDKAVMISGDNHSDDLFMFIKKKITGLLPATTYQVRFDVELASNAATTSVGIGGSPGVSVSVKCGATAVEPVKILDAMQYYRMNIDIGNQANPGADMDTIGNVGVTDTTTVYALITRSNAAHPFTVTTDASGAVWVIVGTDSGFEGITTLYYNHIVVTFSYPVPVELSSFTAVIENGIPVLRWSTETETANRGFEIVRSTDANRWEHIGFVPGHGTTTRRNSYRYSDLDIPPDAVPQRTLFYRLRQVDFDGSESLSPVVSLTLPRTSALPDLLPLYPSPVRTAAVATVLLPQDETVSLTAHDVSGRLLMRIRTGSSLRAGTHSFAIPAAALPNGPVFLRMVTGRNTVVRKLFVSKY